MSSANSNTFILTDYARNLIAFKARQLSRRRGYGPSDRDELEQEIWLAVINQADSFDPSRASVDTFIDRVVNSAVGMILRERRRKKRGNGVQAASLDVPPSGAPDNQPLSAEVSSADARRRLGFAPHDDTAVWERDQAVTRALAVMPPEIRAVCRRVMRGSISSAAREQQTSRRQIRKALAAARVYLEDAGVDAG